MSKKVTDLLKRYGPMLSGELARKFEQEYKVSNTTARQALSRAKSPVNKICTLSFDKNQKFFYLESQYMSKHYTDRLMEAIKSSSQVNWAYVCAFRAQNGYIAKDILIVECKATRSALDKTFVEKWLKLTIQRIRSWVLARYEDGRKVKFQLWSLGGFTQEAASMLASASSSTKKYEIQFFDKSQIIKMAKAHKVQPVVDVLHQHFQPPLKKAIQQHLK